MYAMSPINSSNSLQYNLNPPGGSKQRHIKKMIISTGVSRPARAEVRKDPTAAAEPRTGNRRRGSTRRLW